MKKTLTLIVATVFALSAMAFAGETSATNTAPTDNAASASASTDSGSSSIVKQQSKKKKKKKKKKHSA